MFLKTATGVRHGPLRAHDLFIRNTLPLTVVWAGLAVVAGWRVGWLVGWLAGWLGWLVGWLAGWLKEDHWFRFQEYP